MSADQLSLDSIVDTVDSAGWIDCAVRQIEAVPVGAEFVASDVLDSLPVPANPNHVGLATRHARRLGLITPIGYEPSTVASRHGGVVRRWRRVA